MNKRDKIASFKTILDSAKELKAVSEQNVLRLYVCCAYAVSMFGTIA